MRNRLLETSVGRVLVTRTDNGATRLVLFDERGLPVREEGTVHDLGGALRDLLWVPDDEAQRLAADLAAEWPDVRAGGGFLNLATPWATVLAWAVAGAVVALVAAWLVNRLF